MTTGIRAQLLRGDFPNARPMVDRAIAAYGSDPYWGAHFRLLEAELLAGQRDAQGARALLGTIRIPDGLPELQARARLLSGNAAITVADYELARKLLEEASQLAGSGHLQFEVQMEIGRLLAETDTLRGADAFLLKLQERAEAENEHLYLARILNNRAYIRMRRFRYDEAIPLYEAALTASEQADAQRHIAVILGNLAVCRYRLGDFDRALALRQKAVSVQEPLQIRGSLQRSLGEIGNIYLLQGKPATAVPYYERALAIARALKGRNDVAMWAGNLARAYAETENWPASEKLNAELLAYAKETNDRTFADEARLNQAYIASGQKRYQEAVDIYNQVLATSPEDPAAIWEAEAGLAQAYSLNGETRRASAHFENALEVINRTRSDLLSPDHKITFLTSLIRFFQHYVHFLVREGRIEDALGVAESSRARVLSDRLELSPAAPRERNYRHLARKADAVLVSYWVAPGTSFVWIVTPDVVKCVRLPGSEMITGLSEAYRETILGLRDPLEWQSEAGRQLSDALLNPVRPFLKKGDRVIVVPDGALSALNFETLPIFEGTPHYWLEDATVAVAPALYTLDSPPPVTKGRRSLLLIGDPEAHEPNYPRLRHAAEEIADIRKAFSFADPSVYTGTLASPVAYENALPGEFAMIHFAAHAEANRESPLDSAVILSRSTDGFKLYARDILQSPLRTDLVTISACRSAGDKAYSGEGLVGFAWAFLHAGSRAVIAGLWDVADRSTAELMTVLYRELADGAAPIDALRTAKLSLLKTDGVVRKPYYWGPFQLYIRNPPR